MPLTRKESHGSGCPWPMPPSRGQQKDLMVVLGKPGYRYTAHTEQNNVLASCLTLSILSLIFALTEFAWYSAELKTQGFQTTQRQTWDSDKG